MIQRASFVQNVSRTPPGDQANHERWSLVYFSRPYDTVVLDALADESSLIADAVTRAPDPTRWHTGQTAEAWVARRIKYRRATNHKASLDRIGEQLRFDLRSTP